jgi:hypothetical protein
MNFQKLASIDVNEHIEKKAGLSYLSWAWAVDQIMRQDPEANWTFHEPQSFADGTMMVSVTVTVFNKPINMHLPVMDHRNKAIPNPDAFAINKAMMRCLVKAIACHGLGLYIYAGEDLPANDMTLEEFTAKYLDKMQEAAANGTEALRKAYSELPTNKVAKQFWEAEGDALILWAKGVDNG